MPNKVTRTMYVAYDFSNIKSPEVEVIDKRDPQYHANLTPEGSTGFEYYDVVTCAYEDDDCKVEFSSPKQNVQKYLVDGELFTRGELSKKPGYAFVQENTCDEDSDDDELVIFDFLPKSYYNVGGRLGYKHIVSNA